MLLNSSFSLDAYVSPRRMFTWLHPETVLRFSIKSGSLPAMTACRQEQCINCLLQSYVVEYCTIIAPYQSFTS